MAATPWSIYDRKDRMEDLDTLPYILRCTANSEKGIRGCFSADKNVYFGLAYRVILRTLASMSASSQGRFCIRSRQGYQRLHSCNPLLPCLPPRSASSDY